MHTICDEIERIIIHVMHGHFISMSFWGAAQGTRGTAQGIRGPAQGAAQGSVRGPAQGIITGNAQGIRGTAQGIFSFTV